MPTSYGRLYPSLHKQVELPEADTLSAAHECNTPPIQYVLVGHEEQVSVRGSFCEPSTQIVVDAVHPAPSPASKYPDIHVQSVIDLLPAGELDPVGHALHTNAPIASLYVSAPHALQAIPECAAVYPALQTHDVINVLALGDVVKTGHAMQFPSP